MARRVLIIKTGEIETFQMSDFGQCISLGDVLRTSSILHLLSHDQVTWLTSEPAAPLLKDLGIQVCTDWNKIQIEEFDLIVSLERHLRYLNTLSQGGSKSKILGFLVNEVGEVIVKTPSSIETFQEWNRRWSHLHWENQLFMIFDRPWNNEGYCFSQKTDIKPEKRIGLNWKVGNKWPNKALSISAWEQIDAGLRGEGVVTSWQQGFDDLEEYINWIRSCEILITHDSLGFHLALALNRKVVLLTPDEPFDVVKIYNKVQKWI